MELCLGMWKIKIKRKQTKTVVFMIEGTGKKETLIKNILNHKIRKKGTPQNKNRK